LCNYIQKQERKTNQGKTSSDIILKTVEAVKIHNLFIRQAAVEFNMNYRVLSRYCKKIFEYDYQFCGNQSRIVLENFKICARLRKLLNNITKVATAK